MLQDPLEADKCHIRYNGGGAKRQLLRLWGNRSGACSFLLFQQPRQVLLLFVTTSLLADPRLQRVVFFADRGYHQGGFCVVSPLPNHGAAYKIDSLVRNMVVGLGSTPRPPPDPKVGDLTSNKQKLENDQKVSTLADLLAFFSLTDLFNIPNKFAPNTNYGGCVPIIFGIGYCHCKLLKLR